LLIADFRWATAWDFAVAVANNSIPVHSLSARALLNPTIKQPMATRSSTQHVWIDYR